MNDFTNWYGLNHKHTKLDRKLYKLKNWFTQNPILVFTPYYCWSKEEIDELKQLMFDLGFVLVYKKKDLK